MVTTRPFDAAELLVGDEAAQAEYLCIAEEDGDAADLERARRIVERARAMTPPGDPAADSEKREAGPR